MAPHPASLPTDSLLVRDRRLLGRFELTVCTDGTYLLDGGAMFGVVPKTLWSRRTPADAENRILLGLNTLVVRTGSAVVLIETGIGNKQPPRLKAIHAHQERLPESLAAAGIHPAEVTHVLNTHLHFDHCGWNTTLHPDGTVTPTFPNARYFAAAGELAHGRLQLERDRISYLGPNYDPLLATGQLTLLDPGGAGQFSPTDHRLGIPSGAPAPTVQTSAEIVPGISVEPFPGHTESMLAVHITSGGQHACYPGDLIPTHHHLDPTWAMSYDLDPVRTIAERHRFYARAIPEQWLVVFTHDHAVPTGTVEWNDKGKPVLKPATPSPTDPSAPPTPTT